MEYYPEQSDLRLLKSMGIMVPKTVDAKLYYKSREFQILLKRKAMKHLLVEMQKCQDLPVSTEPIFELFTNPHISSFLSTASGSRNTALSLHCSQVGQSIVA